MDGTVLVADDDRTIRTVLTQALTRAGCKVHATSSLTTLMRWVGEGKGDAVITDVMMPDGNGLEMLPKIAQDRPGLPVIVISAQNTIMTAIKAEEAEAFDYLPKPFDLPDIMKRTARALERAGMKIDEIDLYEVNEAFAPVPLAWAQATGADPAKLNVNGGAIALGHPLGASGAKLMTTLVHALHARGKRFGLQTMCEGGGIANVTIVEAL